MASWETIIIGRTDNVSVEFDDDMIWTGQNSVNGFSLRRATHVKDDGKGIISHTAVTSITFV